MYTTNEIMRALGDYGGSVKALERLCFGSLWSHERTPSFQSSIYGMISGKC